MNKSSTKSVNSISYENSVNIGNNFVFFQDKKLGSGSFGEIYKGKNLKTGEDLAVKMELSSVKHPVLENEFKMLTLLQEKIGFPRLYDYISFYKNKYLMLQLLGPSCEQIKESNGGTVPLKSALMLGLQMLERLECMHDCELIYRDVKPDNILIGTGSNTNIVYLVDFGLSKRYIDPLTRDHIPLKEGKNITGTVRYVSISTHLGYEQSRRDDLESLCYILIYMVKGSLPWQGMKGKNKKEKYEKIGEKKKQVIPGILCKNLQEEFLHFIKHCLSLKFEEKPDYSYLRDLLKKCCYRYDYQVDYIFNWKLDMINLELYSKEEESSLVIESKIEEKEMKEDYSDFKDEGFSEDK